MQGYPSSPSRGTLAPEASLKRLATRMVNEQLIPRNINDPRILEAMLSVPRHLFVPEALQARAYEDSPTPIGYGQTISQPYIVALMTSLLELESGLSVLEVGTGSGYQAAILAYLGLTVFTVERVRELYFSTQELFKQACLDSSVRKIRTKLADGTLGWPEQAPFDRIIVTAGSPIAPLPLLEQLADPGIMVIPLGETKKSQRLVRIFKQDGKVTAKALAHVAFVDLIGDHGW